MDKHHKTSRPVEEAEENAFGKHLKSLRKRHGLTAKEMVKDAYISEATYYKYEQGKIRPKDRNLIAHFCEKLKLEKYSEDRVKLFWLAGNWIERATTFEGLPGKRCRRLWGREDETGDVTGVLLNPQGQRIVLLSAFGGYGKTEFARDVAVKLVEEKGFKDAAWLSLKQEEYLFTLDDVQPVSNPVEPVLTSVIQRLKYRLMCLTEDDLKSRLQNEPLLVVIDNVESLPPSDRERLLSSIHELLGNGPSRAIFTSRFDLTAPYIAKPPFKGLKYQQTLNLLRDEALARLPKTYQLVDASENQLGKI